MGVELGIELGEALAIRAALKWIAPRFDRAALEPAQTLQHVLRPADGLSKLPVADHIDAGFGLPADDIGDRSGQAMIVCLQVERFARLLGTQELLQRLRPNQAADMGREDAINTSFHLVLRAPMKMVRPSSSHSGHRQIARGPRLLPPGDQRVLAYDVFAMSRMASRSGSNPSPGASGSVSHPSFGSGRPR